MGAKRNIIIHVGMHKTGTTYLQQDVFPFIPNIYFSTIEDPFFKLASRLSYKNPHHYDIAELKQEVLAYLETIEQDNILISYERLFGLFYTSYVQNKYIASVLKDIFPDAKIMMSFRKQDDWYESVYSQVLHEGGYIAIEDFLKYRQGEFVKISPQDVFQGAIDVRLNWNPFIKNYQEVFGKDNVLVLPYEMLRKDISQYLQHFYAFTGFPEYYPTGKSRYYNRGYSLISAHLALSVNRWIKNYEIKRKMKVFLQEHVDRHFYIKHKFIKPKMRTRLMALHKSNNKKLSQLINIDLQQYGYY